MIRSRTEKYNFNLMAKNIGNKKRRGLIETVATVANGSDNRKKNL